MTPTIREVARDRGFVESPLYDPSTGLMFADETIGGIWRVGPEGEPPCAVVPHRRGVSGLGLHASGALLLSGRNLAAKWPEDPQGRTVVLVKPDGAARTAFGDLVVDPQGRVLVGTLGYRPTGPEIPVDPSPGQLLRVELDRSLTVLDEDVLLSNGLGFNPQGDLLYAVDSVRNHVLVREYASDGAVGPPEVFARIGRGVADGLTVSADGRVLVATLAGGVLMLDPQGRQTGVLDLGSTVTSVCFGGSAFTDLVATVVDADLTNGRVLVVPGVGKGLPVHRARVDLGKRVDTEHAGATAIKEATADSRRRSS